MGEKCFKLEQELNRVQDELKNLYKKFNIPEADQVKVKIFSENQFSGSTSLQLSLG